MALERLLVARAAAWAAEVAHGRVCAAYEPAAAAADAQALVGDRIFPLAGEGTSARIGAAVDRALSTFGAPLLVVWPELPHWRPDHDASALGDLADGCDLSVGPVFDGGFYMLALARPVPELFALPDHVWRGPEAMGLALGAAHAAGLQVGLLRAERGLRREADVRAALADPLLDDELAALLVSGRD